MLHGPPGDIAVLAFGYKHHAAIDRRLGFIRSWSVTSAAAYDGAQLCNMLDRSNTGSKVWADLAHQRTPLKDPRHRRARLGV